MNALLSSPEKIIELKQDRLLDIIYFEAGDQGNGGASVKGEYIYASENNIAEADGSWFMVQFDGLKDVAWNTGKIEDIKNSALLIKYRGNDIDGSLAGYTNNDVFTIISSLSLWWIQLIYWQQFQHICI